MNIEPSSDKFENTTINTLDFTFEGMDVEYSQEYEDHQDQILQAYSQHEKYMNQQNDNRSTT